MLTTCMPMQLSMYSRMASQLFYECLLSSECKYVICIFVCVRTTCIYVCAQMCHSVVNTTYSPIRVNTLLMRDLYSHPQ